MNNIIAKIKESWQIYATTLMIGIVLGGLVVLLLKGNGGFVAGGINPYPPKASEVGGDWLAKIDDYAISKNDFDEGYKYFISQIPEAQRSKLPDESVIKKQYFDNLVGQYVITIKALNEGIANSKDGQMLLKTALRQAVYQIYLNKNMPQDPAVFMPSKMEIDQFNQQYMGQFDKLGYSAEQRRQAAIQQLSQTKMQQWAAEFVTQTKENYKVQRNNDLLNKEGFNQISSGNLLSPSPAINPSTGK